MYDFVSFYTIFRAKVHIDSTHILAGQEMCEESFQEYNSVVVEFLEDTGLMGDFQAVAAKVKIIGVGGSC